MDFYEAQEQAHKTTRKLGFLFVLSVIAVMSGVGLLCVAVFSQGNAYLSNSGAGQLSLSDLPWEIFVGGALVAGMTILVPFGYKSMQLSGGGDIVAKDLGGRLLDGSPSDFHDQRLLNVVEEMALASGVPVPMVYVMDREDGINAFAAGTEPANAVIGVTRGCLERLSREELQGVIAHEFSHILNGDMKMNMKMVGWVFGLTAISIIGRILIQSLTRGRIRVGGNSRDQNSGQIVMVMMALGAGLMVIGGLGVFFARFLQAAISRQREYLADASAVQFTRNPDSIAGALSKIGGFRDGSKVTAPKSSEASHLFFANGGLFSFGFKTHPPLKDRIQRIKKDWDGSFQKPTLQPIKNTADNGPTDGRISSFAGEEQYQAPEPIITPISTPSLPPVFVEAAHDTTHAQLLIFAMLASSGGGTEGMEVRHLQEISSDQEGLDLINTWSTELDAISSLDQVALIDIAIPTLRRLSYPAKSRFIDITRELTHADREVSLFEYMLQQVIERHLIRHAQGASYAKVNYHRIEQINPQVELLSELMHRCEQNQLELAPKDIRDLHDTLDICQHASQKVKNQLVRALHQQAQADHQLTDREAELLRAVADAIGCAIPLGALK